MAHEVELFSAICIEWEKLIYRHLPQHQNILECLQITGTGILFPFMQHGHLRGFCQYNFITEEIKDRWIKAAVVAIAYIHSSGIIHADINPRNFLVTVTWLPSFVILVNRGSDTFVLSLRRRTITGSFLDGPDPFRLIYLLLATWSMK